MTEAKIYCNADCKYNKGHCTHPENLDKGCYGGIDRVYVEKCELFKLKEDETDTTEVVEVRHGEWLLDGRCSECLENPLTTHRTYCPNCGAKMDGKGKNELLENSEQLVKTNDILARKIKKKKNVAITEKSVELDIALAKNCLRFVIVREIKQNAITMRKTGGKGFKSLLLMTIYLLFAPLFMTKKKKAIL